MDNEPKGKNEEIEETEEIFCTYEPTRKCTLCYGGRRPGLLDPNCNPDCIDAQFNALPYEQITQFNDLTRI